jgi:hypothetical protein
MNYIAFTLKPAPYDNILMCWEETQTMVTTKGDLIDLESGETTD